MSRPDAGRRGNLRAALGFLQVPPTEPELQLLHRWFNSWAGLGLVADGMQRQGWDLQLTAYGDGHWRVTEGFETADLREARMLQDEINAPEVSSAI